MASYSTMERLPELQDSENREKTEQNSVVYDQYDDIGNKMRKGSSESRGSGSFLPPLNPDKGCSSPASSSCNGEYGQDADNHFSGHIDNKIHTHIMSSRTNYSRGSSQANTPTKFPLIENRMHKSNSVASLYSTRSRASNDSASRAEFCRSPSCPSLWTDYETEAHLVEDGDLNASIHPHHVHNRNTKGNLKLPEIFSSTCSVRSDTDTVVTTSRKIASRTKSLTELARSNQFDKDLSKQRVLEQPDPQTLRKAHRQQQLQRQMSQPTALLLPIRDTSRVHRHRKDKSSLVRPRPMESSSQSYVSTFSVKSDSGISSSVRPSDISDVSNRGAEEYSEWSGWEDGEEVYPEVEEEEEAEDFEKDEKKELVGCSLQKNDSELEHAHCEQERDYGYYEPDDSIDQYDVDQPIKEVSRENKVSGHRQMTTRTDSVHNNKRHQLGSKEKCQEWLQCAQGPLQQDTPE